MDIKKEIVDSIQVMVEAAIKKYCPALLFGIVTSIEQKKQCRVKINGVEYLLNYYGNEAPIVNQKYPVFIPSGNLSLAFIIT